MKSKTLDLVVLIEQDEDGLYIAKVPDIQGCYTQGKTVEQAMERCELVFSQDDEWKVKNVISHGKNVKHVVFPFDEFMALLAPHFDLESIETAPEWEYSDLFPIFVFKAKP